MRLTHANPMFFQWIVYGLTDGSVQQYDGFTSSWSQLQDGGWGSAVSILEANFIPNPNFQDMLVESK